jgi:leucyl aminopeptidase
MLPAIQKSVEIQPDISCIYLIRKNTNLEPYSFSKTEHEFVQKRIADGDKQVVVNAYFRQSFILVLNDEKDFYYQKEDLRKGAFGILEQVRSYKIPEILLIDELSDPELAIAFLEGFLLSAYKFDKYLTAKKEKEVFPTKIMVYSSYIRDNDLNELSFLSEAVYMARDLVNEPVVYLNAQKFSELVTEALARLDCKVEVLSKNRIQSLRMGGLLAVNKGSVDPPCFSIIEWNPENKTNDRPVILVGKGIVFDTGGLSLKPTKDSMDYMKSDMSGAAAVFGAMYAVAKNKLPLQIIGLIPATDNRPGGNAMAPGDIITMHNGTTVEIANTDAEGRLILADALSYAKQYDPSLVIDLATLTGSAAAAIGSEGMVAFSTADDDTFEKLEESGWNVFERLVRFPLWEDYQDAIKSDIADLKNLGGKYAGAITAAKFLEHFTEFPWIHLDIAGTSFLSSAETYRGKGGTGSGVRLLYDFLKNLA